MGKLISFLLCACALLLATSQHTLAQKTYTRTERQSEEARILAKIEQRLDWRNRPPEKLDEVSDAERLLRADLNESTLLRKATGERFGVFESFDDTTNTKTFEIRLHRKNRITDRFLLYMDECKSASIAAKKVESRFAVYVSDCYSDRNPTYYSIYLFDYASRNFYLLCVLDYYPDSIPNSGIKLENGIYKMRWSVRLRGNNKNSVLVRNFKIRKTASGEWEVSELPPFDDSLHEIITLEKLPIKPEYDLPTFVVSRGKK